MYYYFMHVHPCIRSHVHIERGRAFMARVQKGFKRLSADIPEELYKDFAKECVEKGVSKRELLIQIIKNYLQKN